MCFVPYTWVHHAMPTPQTQTNWLLCKDTPCSERVFGLNPSLCSETPRQVHHIYHDLMWTVRIFPKGRERLTDFKNQPKLQAFCWESAQDVLRRSQSWSSMSHHLLSLNPQLMSLILPERAIDAWALLPGPLSLLPSEAQPAASAILATQ